MATKDFPNYRVSIRVKDDGKYAVYVESRAQHSGTGMPMGELDTIDQASTVAHFLQDAFHQCVMKGISESYDRALALIARSAGAADGD